MEHDPRQQPLRVVIQQRSLAQYRVPVYRELNSRPGLSVHLVHAKSGHIPNLDPDGFEASSIPMHQHRLLGGSFFWHTAQWRYARCGATDVLVLSWDLHYTSLVPAMLRAKMAGVPTVLWGHGYSKREAPWRAKLRALAARLGTVLLFYNHTTARRYLDQGWDPSRVFVALNALDQQPIQAARQSWLDRPDELESFRRQHRLDQGPVILFVSRFQPRNRLDLLIKAVAQLKETFPSVQAAIVGRGEPEETKIRQLVASLKLDDHVRFLGAIYEERDIAPWFLSADAFCYPANIGLSILHAFGYGLPVITSNNIDAQNPEIEALRDGENGLLYDDGSETALARTLERLFKDPQLAKRLGDEARHTVLERFTLTNMVDAMEAAIRWSGGQRRC